MATIRYIVTDVDKSIEFYTKQLGFDKVEQYGAAMAIVAHGDLSLWLAGGRRLLLRGRCRTGRQPAPGGWNRLVLEVEDLAALTVRLKAAGLVFRNDTINGQVSSRC
ncbi:MAG: VOC family protein [Anaerolineales bacterium]